MACRLYLLTPPQLDSDFPDILTRALDQDQNHIAALQLRLKKPGGQPENDALIKQWAQTLKPIVKPRNKARNITFIINDRPDIARDVQADGVHLGEDDICVRDARAMLGNDFIIGASAYNSRHRAMVAGQHGADYVAFGAFFPTNTKQPKTRAIPDILTQWHATSVMPAVAIGGINPDNAAILINAKADLLAVSSGIWHHPRGANHAISLFNKLLAHTKLQDTQNMI